MIVANGWVRVGEAFAALQSDDLPAARRIAAANVRELEPVIASGELQLAKTIELSFSYEIGCRAELLSGEFAAAQRSALKATEGEQGGPRCCASPQG